VDAVRFEALAQAGRERLGSDPGQARALLRGSDLRLQLQLMNAALVMLGERAPHAWRAEVSRGLFIGERGYFAPMTSEPAVAPAQRPQPRDSKSARILSSPVG